MCQSALAATRGETFGKSPNAHRAGKGSGHGAPRGHLEVHADGSTDLSGQDRQDLVSGIAERDAGPAAGPGSAGLDPPAGQFAGLVPATRPVRTTDTIDPFPGR